MNNTGAVVTTPRLRMRELEPQHDAAFMHAVLNDPSFVRNVGDRGVRTKDEAANYIATRIAPSYERFGFGMWCVELAETSERIGICGLLKRDTLDDVDIGFSFLEPYRSHGYASEAAAATMEFAWSTARLPRLVAITAPHNADSIRLLTKLGFECERRIRLTPEAEEVLLFAIEAPKVPMQG